MACPVRLNYTAPRPAAGKRGAVMITLFWSSVTLRLWPREWSLVTFSLFSVQFSCFWAFHPPSTLFTVFPPPNFSSFPSLPLEFMISSPIILLYKHKSAQTHTHLHAHTHGHTHRSCWVCLVAYMYMCLGLTTWELITYQGPRRKLVLPSLWLPVVLPLRMGGALWNFPYPNWHINEWSGNYLVEISGVQSPCYV